MPQPGRTNGDEKRIEAARDNVRNHPEDPDAYRRLAGALYIAGEIEEAVPHLEKAVDLSGGAVEYRLALADVLFDALRPKEAACIYEELLSDVEEERRRRVKMTLALARSETAFVDAVYIPLSALPLDDPRKPLLEGTLALLQGRNSEAMNRFEQALSSAATARRAQENVAFLWSVMKEMPPDGEGKLVSHLLEARKSGEPSARFLLYLADAYANSNLLEKAAELMVASLKQAPVYLPAYDQAGGFLRQLNIHGEQMADSFRKAVNAVIDRLPEHLAAPARRRFSGTRSAADSDAGRSIKTLLASDDPEERKLGMLEAAELLTPEEALGILGDDTPVEDPVARLVLARLRLRTAGMDRAVETVLDALRAYPESAEVAYAAAYFLGLRRRFVSAQKMIEAGPEASKIAPDILMETGMVFVEAGDYAAALELTQDRSEPEAVAVRARALARSGREEDALAELEHAWGESPHDVIRRELAAAYYRLGRDEDAVKVLTK
ncbi:MAG: tetratricopeptide repeat protein [Planctomycetes bacterium]|nr:tetratricopeptide repeat protein [Planctomycetota bacterium]